MALPPTWHHLLWDPGCKNASCEILVPVQGRWRKAAAFPQNVRHKLWQLRDLNLNPLKRQILPLNSRLCFFVIIVYWDLGQLNSKHALHRSIVYYYHASLCQPIWSVFICIFHRRWVLALGPAGSDKWHPTVTLCAEHLTSNWTSGPVFTGPRSFKWYVS